MRTQKIKMYFVAILMLLSFSVYSGSIETIIMIRHGEKTPIEVGQLNCRGLNRSLLLPHYFKTHFAKPNYIFAPNPSFQITSKGKKYSYVRALATIEPTAIQLDMPVNAQIGYMQYEKLMDTLLEKKYHHATIYVAWEHMNLMHFATAMLKKFHSQDRITYWPNNDYSTVYVFEINWKKQPAVLHFHTTSEGINHLSAKCSD